MNVRTYTKISPETSSRFAEIVGNYFPIFHARRSLALPFPTQQSQK
jgi:hypothetical protein